MNYGLPYKGSKNTIAEQLVKALPRGNKLLDACCGGGGSPYGCRDVAALEFGCR